MSIPQNLKYSKTHEWVSVKDKTGIVGITDFAQKELGDIVYVELPKVGQKIKLEDPCAVVESVKAASDIYAPISGTVTRINDKLQKETGLVNQDPYGEGWFFEITIESPKELEELLESKAYQDLVGAQA
ncbi:MAG: glycine cleavage system protein GcvH [Chlamydiae bacterium]|nr:glycine cleavage system protein GcvH [Chlamydiota bacterium]MBI3276888.1 glycine cleavage system protein GcvH [Chlamydiota bacterium]